MFFGNQVSNHNGNFEWKFAVVYSVITHINHARPMKEDHSEQEIAKILLKSQQVLNIASHTDAFLCHTVPRDTKHPSV